MSHCCTGTRHLACHSVARELDTSHVTVLHGELDTSHTKNAEDTMTGRRKGSKELGKRGTKWHRKLLHDNIQSISISANDYLAHRVGINLIHGETCGVAWLAQHQHVPRECDSRRGHLHRARLKEDGSFHVQYVVYAIERHGQPPSQECREPRKNENPRSRLKSSAGQFLDNPLRWPHALRFLMCVSTVGCSRLMTSADSVSVSHTSKTNVSIKSLQYRAMGVDHIARRLTATSMRSQTSQRLTQLGAREATRLSPASCFSLMTTIRSPDMRLKRDFIIS
uniref:Uncharacterized protein n=2 Tax=Timema TaxID=61471 RepID=A0A7R9IR48_9NEOP|nr:unnamed protein product [Timema tahoe]